MGAGRFAFCRFRIDALDPNWCDTFFRHTDLFCRALR